MYLLDTNMLSPSMLVSKRSDREIEIAQWIEASSDRLFISVISVAEIEAGIAKSERQGASRKAADLSRWLSQVIQVYADRILPLDLASARLAGRLLDKAYGAGGLPDFEDAAIAAIAHSSNLQVLTRNTRHFRLFGVKFLDPYDHLP